MRKGGRGIGIILAVLILFALVGVAAATVAEGCKWRDNNPQNGVRDKNPDGVTWAEPCEAGWVLHVVVMDETGKDVPGWDKNFVTNTDGSSGKFSIGPLPVPPLNTEYTITISEPDPKGYVVIVPDTVEKSYTQKYSQSRTVLSGFLFGNQPIGISAQGCKWVDADKDGERNKDTELCEAGWTLHIVVKDENGVVQSGWDKDFVTNTDGEEGRFFIPLPVPIPNRDWTVTISEAPSDKYVVIGPENDDNSYTQAYSASRTILTGFFFGNQEKSDPVPVPEFPTVAVSILTISGMFIAVQFMKKRN